MKLQAASGLRILCLAALLATLLLFSACSGSKIAGKYVSEQNPAEYLELKGDGSFYLREEGIALEGKYLVEGDEITLSVSVLGIPTATKGRIAGNVITDDDGERWVKGDGAAPTATTKSSGSPSATLRQTPTPKPVAKYRVAFAARVADGKTNIYVMKEDGTNLNKIADGGERPIWSPDGQRIAFISTASGDQGALYVVKPDGTSLAKLSPPGVFVAEFLWSPDGQFLFYADGRRGMHVISADGVTDTKKELPGTYQVNAASYTWSTEGPKVAIWWSGLGDHALIIHDFNSGNRAVVGEVLPHNMIWSPEGTRLLYALEKDGYYVVNADGSLPAKVIPRSKSERFINESAVLGATWAPSGKKLAYWTREGKAYTIDEDGSDDRQLAEGLLVDYDKALVVWSPDSRKLAFIAADDKVHVISVDGSSNVSVGEGVRWGDPLWGKSLRTYPEIVWSSDSTKLFVRTATGFSAPELQAKTYVVGADGQGQTSVATLLATAPGGLSLVGNLMWEPALKAAAVDRLEVRVKRMHTGSGCSATDPGAVQTLDIEKEYLPVVVASENGAAGVPFEALKAQAVASRTFAIYKMQYEPRSTTFDLCDTEADQVYNPSVTVSPQVRKAVEETRGMVANWNGEVIAAFFVKGDQASGTARFVTVNDGKRGGAVTPTALGSSTNSHNRGAMGQDKANELAAQGWDYQRILRYFYGADLTVEPFSP